MNLVILVDGPNTHFAMKSAQYRINWQSLDDLVEGTEVVAHDYYSPKTTDDTGGWDRFVHFLEKRANFTLHVGVQSDIDTDLINQLLSLASNNEVEGVLLVGGDGDYFQAAKQLVTAGKKLFILSHRDHINAELAEIAEQIFYLEDDEVRDALYYRDLIDNGRDGNTNHTTPNTPASPDTIINHGSITIELGEMVIVRKGDVTIAQIPAT